MDTFVSFVGQDITLIVGALAALALTFVAIVRDLAISRPMTPLLVEAGPGNAART